MPSVNVTIPAGDDEAAQQLAAAIRDAAEINYTNVEGDMVTVTVGNVTVS